MKHYKYIQHVNSVPVDGSEFLVHVNKEGEVVATNGNLQPEASKKLKNTKAKIDTNKALKKAWKHIDLNKEETIVEKDLSDPFAFSDVEDTVENAELVVYENEGKFLLAYKVNLQFIQPYGANWMIYINAKNGKVISSQNVIHEASTTGYGYGVNGDKKSLNTYYYNGTYYLYDETKSAMSGTIQTRTANNYTSLPGSYSTDRNNAWTSRSQGAAVDAHANAEIVYDYFYETHDRNSFDDRGSTIRSTVNYDSNYNNAFWNGTQMVYGDGDGYTFDPLSGALDVVAHELTHAVTEYTAGLEYVSQSGALNESFSDVFGYFVEPEDFLLGEDIYTPSRSGDALRSLSDPTLYDQPAHMNNYQNLPETKEGDWGGVHINSGIPNKAAYYTIQEIGDSKAEKIYYRALTNYLTSTSQFTDARAALLQSAADIYGSNSTEYNAVKDAWNAVGVY
ncbi:M4 family metallopeptidase [Bacillus carboniphilus]|uniref:Neutral metalloproteinase n=1 Tax=Bacillus carboniphilus TaxID=86663 RepID=A0ABY9JSN5_9BACI|nr:M4 family metallopeptidase [Bacillus carboniphilus]WLR41268.1 M4 family metallopeptidase [Bacillus carboniphilus]